MILSAQQILSDDQAITSTAASTNIIDLGAPSTVYGAAAATARDIGPGEPVPILVQVTEDFAATGSATLSVALQVDDGTNFSGAVTVWSSGAIGKATLVEGYKFYITGWLPEGINQQYVRLNYTVASGPMTAGKITAGITFGNQTNT